MGCLKPRIGKAFPERATVGITAGTTYDLRTMHLSDIISAIQSSTFGDLNSPISLIWGRQNAVLSKVFMPQRIDIREGMFEGIDGQITCLSTRVDLPLSTFIGAPIGVQFVTDKGAMHRICGIVTAAESGESDGALATYQLTLQDALSVLDRRTNTRVFRAKSVPEIIEVLFNEWRTRSTTLAASVDCDLSRINRGRYPKREYTQQINESDGAFFRRLCRREGISWFIAAGPMVPSESPDTVPGIEPGAVPVHTIVLFDFNGSLPDSRAAHVRFHRDSGIEESDTITRWCAARRLIQGSVRRTTLDTRQRAAHYLGLQDGADEQRRAAYYGRAGGGRQRLGAVPDG